MGEVWWGGSCKARNLSHSSWTGSPRPPPLKRWQLSGHPSGNLISESSLNAAGGQQLKAVVGGDSAPALPPLRLVAVPQVSFSKPKKTPWQRGAGPLQARGPSGNLTEGASASPPQPALAKAPSQVGGGRQGLSSPGRGHTWCYLSSAPTWVPALTRGPASTSAPEPCRDPLGRPRVPTPPRGGLRLRSRRRTPRLAALGAVMAAGSSFSGRWDSRAIRGGASCASSILITASSLSRGVRGAGSGCFCKG